MVAVLYFTSHGSLAYCFGFSVHVRSCSPPPPPPPKKKKKKKKRKKKILFSSDLDFLFKFTHSLTRELNIRVVGFVLYKVIHIFLKVCTLKVIHIFLKVCTLRVIHIVLKC